MAGKGPYPVKAFFFLGNNPMMSYANMPMIIDGMMNQDLIVAHEQFMTPSAQLADYVLPADSWLERPWLTDGFGWMSTYRMSEQSMDPPGEARSTFDFWRGIAGSLGREDLVPWDSLDEYYDYRVKGTGRTFAELAKESDVYLSTPKFRKYEQDGFAQPSGKLELSSSVLDDLGFDPLPYFREDPPEDPAYPLKLFTGVREDGFFQTGHRHIPEMRARHPEPQAFVSEGTAATYDLKEGDWVEIENTLGSISIVISIRDSMPDGLVRVPHGWWKPEMEQGAAVLSGARKYADAQLCRDDEDYLDREQGIPHLKGVPCRIRKADAATNAGDEQVVAGAAL